MCLKIVRFLQVYFSARIAYPTEIEYECNLNVWYTISGDTLSCFNNYHKKQQSVIV